MYLVFDIGGTNTRIATSSDRQALNPAEIFPTEQDFEQEIQLISEAVKKLANGEKIQLAAGGVAGTLDREKSLLLKSPHLDSWTHKPLKEELEQVFDTAVYLENDAHLGGLGEASFGAGKGHSIVAFITIGTGVGGARIVNQKIDANSKGFEPGHQIIVPGGNPCDCGGKGHLESYIAGSNLKDPINWEEVAKYLAIGLNNTIVHWSPDIVVLGGFVGQKIPLDRIEQDLKENLTIFDPLPIVYGSLTDNNGLYGGLVLLSSSENITNPLE